MSTFSGQQIYLSLGGRRLQVFDVDEIAALYSREGRSLDALSQANSFILPSGAVHGRGWVVLRKSDVEAAIAYGGSTFQISLGFSDQFGTFQIQKLGIASATALTGTTTKTDEALYLVHLVDARAVAHYSAIDKAYNVRSYRILQAGNAPDYYEPTLNGGAVWSWQEIIDDLWTILPTVMGSVSFDASWPASTAENYIFRGINAWDAIHKILTDTCHTIYRNLAGNWTIRPKGWPQADLDAAAARNRLYLDLPSWGYSANAAPCIPEKLSVFFTTTFNSFKDVAPDVQSVIVSGKDAWLMQPLYRKDITITGIDPDVVPVPGSSASIHHSLAAYYDELGNIVNQAEVDQRALDLAEIYLESKRFTDGSNIHPIYHGFHSDFLPGSQISAVCWMSCGNGPKTEVLLSPLFFRKEDVPMGLGRHLVDDVLSQESVGPPDVARNREPMARTILVKAYDDILPEDYGTAIVLYGIHGGSGAIFWDESSKLIELHNPWPIKLRAGDKFLAFWHDQARRWIASRPQDGLLYKGVLTADMCPAASGYVDNLVDVQSCDVEFVSQVGNPLQLAAMAGDNIIAYRDCETDGFNVLQVQHHEEEYVRADFYQTNGCVDDGYGTLVPTYDCKVKYSKRKISVQWCQLPQENLTLFNTEVVNVMTNWTVSGYVIYGEFRPVYVMCPCDPYPELLAVGEDCSTGSGSGA